MGTRRSAHFALPRHAREPSPYQAQAYARARLAFALRIWAGVPPRSIDWLCFFLTTGGSQPQRTLSQHASEGLSGTRSEPVAGDVHRLGTESLEDFTRVLGARDQPSVFDVRVCLGDQPLLGVPQTAAECPGDSLDASFRSDILCTKRREFGLASDLEVVVVTPSRACGFVGVLRAELWRAACATRCATPSVRA